MRTRRRIAPIIPILVLLLFGVAQAEDLFDSYGWRAQWVTFRPHDLHGDILSLDEYEGGLYATSDNGDLYLYDFEQDAWHDLFNGRNGSFSIGPHPVMVEPHGTISAMVWEAPPGSRRHFPRHPYGGDRPWWRKVHNAGSGDRFYDGATLWSRKSDHEWRILDSLNSFTKEEVLLPDIILVGDRYVKKDKVRPLLMARGAFESTWREIPVPGNGSILNLEMIGEQAIFTRGSAIYVCLPFSPYGPVVHTVLAETPQRARFEGLKRVDRGYVAWTATGEVWQSDNGIENWQELPWELPYHTTDVVSDGSHQVWAVTDNQELYVYEWNFRPGNRWLHSRPVDVATATDNGLRWAICLLDANRVLVGGRDGKLSQLLNTPYQRDWVRYADYDSRYRDGRYDRYDRYDRYGRHDDWYYDDPWRDQHHYRDNNNRRGGRGGGSGYAPGGGGSGGGSGGGGGSDGGSGGGGNGSIDDPGGGDDRPKPPQRRIVPREKPESQKKKRKQAD